MRKTKSPILEAVHDTAKGLHKAGVLDKVTLREFDRLCLARLGERHSIVLISPEAMESDDFAR